VRIARRSVRRGGITKPRKENEMKRILVFVGLKVAEISAVVFIPWGIGLWNPLGFDGTLVWAVGLATIVRGLALPAVVLSICYVIIHANWELSKKIMDRK